MCLPKFAVVLVTFFTCLNNLLRCFQKQNVKRPDASQHCKSTLYLLLRKLNLPPGI